MSLTIYGASDDLIEIAGDITDEFDAYNCTDRMILCGDGTALTITYSKTGVWRITLVGSPHPERVTIVTAPEDDDDNYSDRAHIAADVPWCRVGEVLVTR